MDISNLPRGGVSFKLTKGVGNFRYKLARVTKHGELRNLSDNQKAIVETLKPYTRALKIKGGLNRLQQKSVFRTIKKKEGGYLNWDDKHDVKKVIKYLGRDYKPASGEKNPFTEEKKVTVSDRMSRDMGGVEALRNSSLIRVNRDTGRPEGSNPFIRRVTLPAERHMGIVDPLKTASKAAMLDSSKPQAPSGVKPPQPLAREPGVNTDRLRRVA